MFKSLGRACGLAVRNIFATRWRSSLSLVTILFGSIAVVATFTINSNVDLYVDKLIDKSGGPSLRLVLPPRNDLTFSPVDLRLLRSVRGVMSASSLLSLNQLVFRDEDHTFSPVVHGVSQAGANIEPLKVVEGRLIADVDRLDGKPYVVLSPETVKNLKLTDPIGKVIHARNKNLEFPMVVIGVAKRDSEFSFDSGDAWIAERFFNDIEGNHPVKSVIIRAVDVASLDLLESSIKDLFLNKFGKDLRVINPKRDIEQVRSSMKALVYAGMALGFLALVSGSIGIMNVMLVSVRLRRREVGLYKALGLPAWFIMVQFFAESCFLNLGGGIVGGALGSALGVALSSLLVHPYQQISVIAIVIGLTVTLISGGVFGVVPAIRASRLDPVEALRG